ncbi:MAG: phosphatidylglycerophosphatase A [Candidatus Omnitrophica bacterium]|nr:phosphatidylglycerophosphatase A [Candidatus Omnitrophota bacterium]
MTNFFIKAIATVFGIGYLPMAPGTWATIAGVVITYYLGSQLFIFTLLLLGLLVLGIVSTGLMEKLLNKKDPSIACIDEVVGVMIGLWGLPLSWPVMICGFFLFRAFDMFKIYPINKLENQPGGWGIMLDDCMAGVYTNVILRIALYGSQVFFK